MRFLPNLLRPCSTGFALIAPLLGSTAAAQRAEQVIDTWNTETGLPQNSVNAILQSRDGYLWLATYGGVARFDGATFFAITTGDSPGLRSDRARALAQDRDGRIWIGTENGLSKYEHGRITTLSVEDGLPGAEVNALAATRDDAVWFGMSNGALGRVDASGVHVIVPALGLLGNSVQHVVADSAGSVWVSARTGVWRFNAASPASPPTQLLTALPRQPIPSLSLDRDAPNAIWAATDSALIHIAGDAMRQYPMMRHGELDWSHIRAIAASRGGVVWLGGTNGDVWRFRADSNALELAGQLTSQAIVSLAVDREGSVWVGDRINGLARVRPTLFQSFTQSDGLPQDNIVSVFADSHDRVWAAGRCAGAAMKDGAEFRILGERERGRCVTTFAEDAAGNVWIGGDVLIRWHSGVATKFDSTNGLPQSPIRAMVLARDGTLWISAQRALFSWDGNRFTTHSGDGRVAPVDARVIIQARDGALWFGSERGLFRYANSTFTQFTTANGLPSDFVRGIHQDSAGALWIATYGGGLARLAGDHIDVINTASGLYDNYLSSVTQDRRGDFWLSSNRGVFRIARREMASFLAKRLTRIHSIAYGRADGMLSSEANGGFGTAVARTSDGRLWYPTLVGVAVIDPAKAANAIPPTVAVERVAVDGKTQDPASEFSIGPDVSTVEISYSGLSLTTPSAVTFRYKLEHWDRDWIDAGTRRTVTYSRLPHGHYRFRVIAANRDGVWAEENATFALTILPYFWQTWWFRTLAVIVLVAGAFFGIRLRVRQVRAATEAAERVAAQRREALILDSVTDGFFALDRESRLTYVNRTAERVLGRPATELLGKSFWESFPAAQGTITEDRLRRVAATRDPAVFEAPDTPNAGTWLEMHAYPANDGLSVYFADVTERKRAEDELRSQKEEIEAQAEELSQQADELARQNEILEENVKLKDEVERISRHDLRTPLNTIISLSQVVREDAALSAEHRSSLKLIEQAGHRVLHMASLTLDLFKMEQGTYTLVSRPVDIRAVAERALSDLQAMIRTRDLMCAITTTGFGAARPLITGDEFLAQAMMGNIVKNAVEASPTGGRVTIEIVAGERTRVHVHNSGVIPTAVRSRFFEKYTTSGKKGGTGLGAYSARLMARAQDGDITFESTEAAGTTITIELPSAIDDGTRTETGARSVGIVIGADEDWPARSILVVDDDPGNRLVLRHFLKHPNWRVDEAENGPLAVKLALENRYDVVFMDIEMPVMDGLEATERIRANERTKHTTDRARIVAFTSHDDAATRARAERSGCDLYLPKPASRKAVVEVVLGRPAIPASIATLDPAIRDLVPAFLERKRVEVDELCAALKAGDSEAARRLSHRLRGSLSLYGFGDAAAIAGSIEELVRGGQLDARVSELAATLRTEMMSMADLTLKPNTLEAET